MRIGCVHINPIILVQQLKCPKPNLKFCYFSPLRLTCSLDNTDMAKIDRQTAGQTDIQSRAKQQQISNRISQQMNVLQLHTHTHAYRDRQRQREKERDMSQIENLWFSFWPGRLVQFRSVQFGLVQLCATIINVALLDDKIFAQVEQFKVFRFKLTFVLAHSVGIMQCAMWPPISSFQSAFPPARIHTIFDISHPAFKLICILVFGQQQQQQQLTSLVQL